jgi:hypothetical protein
MAKRYNKLTSIQVFRNDNGKAAYSNGNWSPYYNGQPGTITLDENTKYHIAVFENDNGSLGISISEIAEYEHEGFGDSVSQGGFKQVAQSIESKHKQQKDADDDIPF